MKISITTLLFLITLTCFGQINYYKIGIDSLLKESETKNLIDSLSKTISKGLIIKPIIYHRILKHDTIVNYLTITVIEKSNNISNPDFELVQDSLYLLLNQKLPGFVLKDLNGKKFSSSSLLGKTTMINFWSIYNPFCIKEFSSLNKLKDKYSDTVNFIGIADGTCGNKDIQALFIKNPFNYYILIDGDDYKNNLLHIKSVPHNLFLDKYGYIREIQMGLPFQKDRKTITTKDIQKFEKIIDRISKL
jgi:cytochrome c biogenesis protein CcmG/thiol:disulfide interchange protein DsbE